MLDQKRISDIGIQLSGYSISIHDTVKALLDLDDNAIDSEKMQKLLKISPTTEEYEKLSTYKG